MKKALLLAGLLLLASCVKKEVVSVPNGNPFDNTQNLQQIEALRQALQLNTNNDMLLVSRVTALEVNLDLEEQARAAGDQELADQIAALNRSVTTQISNLNNSLTTYINQQISTVNTNVTSLTARINALTAINNSVSQLSIRVSNLELNTVSDAELDAYKAYVNATYATKQMLDATEGRLTLLTARVVLLEGKVTTLQDLVSSGTSNSSIVKAPCATAKEVLIKVGNSYYSVLNIADTKKHQDDEDNDDDDNRNYKNSYAYLGQLSQNVSYVTTDGTGCNFTINSNNQLQELE